MEDSYYWLKAFHIVAVITWMAGLLYLPRLFVYHSKAIHGSELSETFKIMEKRLYFGIMMPGMLLSLILGGILFGPYGAVDVKVEIWVWVKLACVLGLLAFHGLLGRWRRDFSKDQNKHGPTFFKVVNEVPTLLMILIIVMVIVKPF
tara:strand:- start:100288 stop:100728 length:441 start_codon:yes stop_codon:yes gene_type:complete